MTPIRVMVVDDHSVVREGIRHVLSDPAQFTVVSEASSETLVSLPESGSLNFPGSSSIICQLACRRPKPTVIAHHTPSSTTCCSVKCFFNSAYSLSSMARWLVAMRSA